MKDLTQMSTEKLWKRARAALDELERRGAMGQRAPSSQTREEPRHPLDLTPEQRDAILARRLQGGANRRVPQSDPVYLAAFERTGKRPEPEPEQPTDG